MSKALMKYDVLFGKHFLPKDSECPEEHVKHLSEHVYVEQVKAEVMPEQKPEEVKQEAKKEKKAK